MTPVRAVLAVLVVVGVAAGVGVAWYAREGVTEDRGTSTLPGPIRGVDVRIDSGRVDVVVGAGVGAKVVRTRHYLRGAPTITETFVDGVVGVDAACNATLTLGCSVDIRVEVPAATPVKVRTSGGAVDVGAMTNGVDVATSGGDVRMTGTGGMVKATTSAGSVTGADLAPVALDAVTSGGAIRMSLAQPAGRIDLRTGGGAIDLALPDAPGGYRVTAAGAGKPAVTVVQDPTSGRAVAAHSRSGHIRIHPR